MGQWEADTALISMKHRWVLPTGQGSVLFPRQLQNSSWHMADVQDELKLVVLLPRPPGVLACTKMPSRKHFLTPRLALIKNSL